MLSDAGGTIVARRIVFLALSASSANICSLITATAPVVSTRVGETRKNRKRTRAATVERRLTAIARNAELGKPVRLRDDDLRKPEFLAGLVKIMGDFTVYVERELRAAVDGGRFCGRSTSVIRLSNIRLNKLAGVAAGEVAGSRLSDSLGEGGGPDFAGSLGCCPPSTGPGYDATSLH